MYKPQSSDKRETPVYVTVKRWTELSGLSRSKTYQLLAAGKLPAIRVDARTLIDFKQATEWLASRPKWSSK